MTLQDMHERLLAWVGGEAHKERLAAARRVYFAAFGEPSEEDKSFEQRLNALLDFCLFDYRDESSRTTLEQFLLDQDHALSAEEVDSYRELAKNIHGLFEVRRIRAGELRIRDVFSGLNHDIVERRQIVGLSKGDLIEARLLPFQGRYWFSGAFLYHPQAARKRILLEVKRLKKESHKNGDQPDVKAFLALLSRMAFKMERYRNVKVESIYDFAAAAAPTPKTT